MTAPPPLPVLDLPYAPFVLTGYKIHEGRNRDQGEKLPGKTSWSLWTCTAGGMRLGRAGERIAVPVGASAVLPPASGYVAEIGTGASVEAIEFDLMLRARQRWMSTLAYQPAATADPRTARDLFGCEIPALLPTPLWERTRRAQSLINLLWHLSPQDHLHANAELGLWLALVIREMAAPAVAGRDPLQRAQVHARNLLDRATISSMAAAAGLPQSTFSERFLRECGSTPGTFLVQLRLAGALRRIRAGEWPLAAVARAIGWRKVQTLRRRIRTATGEEPEAFRPQGD